MKTNYEVWQKLHADGYFQKHRRYQGAGRTRADDVKIIESFVPLNESMHVLIIGGGYGRESAAIAPRVGKVYIIDLAECAALAEAYLKPLGIINKVAFIRAESWRYLQDDFFELAYSIATFQHLTRDLTRDYIGGLHDKLVKGGHAVLQFADNDGGSADADPAKILEPSVRWSEKEIREASERAGFRVAAINSIKGLKPNKKGIWRWHWAHLIRE